MATLVRLKSILQGVAVAGLDFANVKSDLYNTYRTSYASNGGTTMDYNREAATFRQLVLNDLRGKSWASSFTSAKIISNSSVTSRIGIQIIYDPAGAGGEYVTKVTSGVSCFWSTPGGAAAGAGNQENMNWFVTAADCLSSDPATFSYAKSQINPRTNHEWFADADYVFVWSTKYIGPDGNYGRWVKPHTQRGTYTDALFTRWNEWFGPYLPCFTGANDSGAYTYNEDCGIRQWTYPAYFCSEWEGCYSCCLRGYMLNGSDWSYEVDVMGRAENINTGGYWGSSGGCWG